MRVALDVGPLLDAPTGVGRYVRELIPALEASGHAVTRYAVSWRGAGADGIRRWRLPARAVQWSWRVWGRPTIDGLVGDVDLVHATNFVLPALGHTPGVVTIHDLSFLRADTFAGGRRLRRLVPWSLRRARGVLVPTRAVKQELVGWAAIDPDLVTVTPEGVSPVFFSATKLSDDALNVLGIRQPYALAVGTIEPRKNLARLVKAWDRARVSLQDWTLVVAGPRGWGPTLPEVDGVVAVGYVGDETLPGLVAGAEFFCYPTLYEGFGLPPLEAMAAAIPVIAGRTAATEEVLGDDALLVDPVDVDGLAEHVAALAGDAAMRARLGRAGRLRAAQFTWLRTAAETETAYRKALGRDR